MPTKHYQARGCNRTIQSEGITFLFEPYILIGGMWFGLYATDDKKEQKALDKLEWIIKLSKEEHDNELKKKRQNTGSYSPLPQGGRQKQVAILGEGAAVVQKGPPETSGKPESELTIAEITKPVPVKGAKKRLKKTK